MSVGTRGAASCCLSFSLVLSLLWLPSTGFSEEIYSSKDSEGRVIYSSTPGKNSIKATDLPSISRENIDAKIKNIKKNTPSSCVPHGGVDCRAGADTDGSVICIDGYREAILPFRFRCLEARLKPVFRILLQGTDEPQKLSVLKARPAPAEPRQLLLVLRNTSAIKAEEVEVEFTLPGGSALRAKGPQEVEAYGSAEYTLAIRKSQIPSPLRRLVRTSYGVRCKNCQALSNRVK